MLDKDKEDRAIAEPFNYCVTFKDLEVGDIVVALAPPGAGHALVLTIGGRAAVELLQICRLFPENRRVRISIPDVVRRDSRRAATQVEYAYLDFRERRVGLPVFRPLMDGDTQRVMVHPYQDPTGTKPSDVIMVVGFDTNEREAMERDGEYAMQEAELNNLQAACVPSPHLPSPALKAPILGCAA